MSPAAAGRVLVSSWSGAAEAGKMNNTKRPIVVRYFKVSMLTFQVYYAKTIWRMRYIHVRMTCKYIKRRHLEGICDSGEFLTLLDTGES